MLQYKYKIKALINVEMYGVEPHLSYREGVTESTMELRAQAAVSSVMDIRDGLVCYKHMQILCITAVGFSFRSAR